jgi:exonuclease V
MHYNRMLGNAYFGDMPLAVVRRSILESDDDASLREESAPTSTSTRQQTIATPPNEAPPPLAMATTTASEYGSDVDLHSVVALSDYGSDTGFEDIDEDTLLADALNTIDEARPSGRGAVLPSIEFEEGEREDEEQDVAGFVQIHGPTLLRLAKGRAGDAHASRGIQSSPMRALEVEYDQRSRRTFSGLCTSSITSAYLTANSA